MNRHLFVAMAVCAMVLGFAATSNAWLIDTTANVDTNSNNKYNSENDNSLNFGDEGRLTTYDSRGSNSNNRYDYSQDRSITASGSFNTDSHNITDASTKDSYNDYANKSNNSVNGSYNKYFTTGGNVRNSVMGDFNQLYSGTDFRSGVTGSGNTIDTSSVNITTLGDTLAK
jgi:hypothetical protein